MRTLARFHSPALPLLVSACLLAGIATLPQQPQKPQTPPTPPTKGEESAQEGEDPQKWPLSADARNAKVVKELLGAWQVVELEHQGMDVPKGSTSGYAIFIDGYMSIEIHLRMASSLPGGMGYFFQTGTHRWRLLGTGQMETASLIGTHNFTPDEQVRFQPAADRRLWEIWLDGQHLMLERRGESKLVLRRLGFLPFPGEVEEFGFKKPLRGDKEKGKEQ